MKRSTVIFFLILLTAGTGLLSADTKTGSSSQSDRIPELIPGRPVRGTITPQSRDRWYHSYKFRITPETMAVRVSLTGAAADLDMYFRYDHPIEDYGETDFSAESDEFNERIDLSRFTDPSLEDGMIYLDVAYILENQPFDEKGRPLRSIPYTLELERIDVETGAPLQPAVPQTGEVSPDRGMTAVFPVTIPRDAEHLRLDLFDTEGDMDLYLSSRPVIRNRRDILALSESVLGNESLVLNLREYGLRPERTYYVTVLDPINGDRPETFSLVCGFTPDPPEMLTGVRPLPEASSPLEKAYLSTVEIITPRFSGSGSFIGRSGHILTNHHVIENPAGGVFDEVTVAVTLSPDRPAAESFRAGVLEYSEELDLALLQVHAGFYGEPLPASFRFPSYILAEEVPAPGEMIQVLGYPTIGASGSRPTITLTRGILSGRERTPLGVYIKTDTVISGGNSGGAALDGEFRLIGVPSFTITSDEESMGYIIPLSMVPDSWLEGIR